MTTRRVAYVGTFLPESLREAHDWSSDSPAGQTKQQSTISALYKAGYHVDVVSSVIRTSDGIGRVSEQVTENDDALIHVPANVDVTPASGPPRLLALLRTIQFKLFLPLFATLYLCSLIRREDYDAIVFYNFNIITAFPALIAGVLFDVPIVIDFNDSRLDSRNRLDRFKDKFYLFAVDPWIAGGICINTNMTSVLRTENTIVVRGEPSVRIADDTTVADNSDEPLTIFYGGKLDDIRGIDTLLEAAPDIVSERNVEVRITGYGPRFEEVQQRVSEMDIDRVTFLGFLSKDRYCEELQASDITLNLQLPDAPGNEYTFPTKILDYLAAGNVVLSTRMSDLETVLPDILVFTEPSSEELAKTLNEVSADFSDHTERIDAGLAWIQENCSPEKRINAISVLLDEVRSKR